RRPRAVVSRGGSRARPHASARIVGWTGRLRGVARTHAPATTARAWASRTTTRGPTRRPRAPYIHVETPSSGRGCSKGQSGGARQRGRIGYNPSLRPGTTRPHGPTPFEELDGTRRARKYRQDPRASAQAPVLPRDDRGLPRRGVRDHPGGQPTGPAGEH